MELQDEGRREKAEDLMKEGLTGYVKPPEKKEEEKAPQLKKTNSDKVEKKEEPAADAIKEDKDEKEEKKEEVELIKGHFEIVVSKAAISHELRRSVISTANDYQVRLRFPSDHEGN